jgi:hypothetical protein
MEGSGARSVLVTNNLDANPGVPETYGSGSGFATLLAVVQFTSV